MGIFRRFIIGLKRAFQGGSIDYTTAAKKYGNEAEQEFAENIRRLLSNCYIKTNVMIHIPKENADAEIDCLIAYQDHLFAVEIKHWKGYLIEEGDSIISRKVDKYTGEVYKKVMRSPFKQIKRAIMLLKKEVNTTAWIEPIVYFVGADGIWIHSNFTWFSDIESIADYIRNYNHLVNIKESIKCFNKSRQADCIYASSWVGQNTCHCVINDNSLVFADRNKTYYRKDIYNIKIIHHYSFDEIILNLRTGEQIKVKEDNKKIVAFCNKHYNEYNLSEIDYIYLGS